MTSTNDELQPQAAAQLRQAHSLLAAGKIRDGASIAESLVRRYPAHPRVWDLLSRVYFQARQYGEAVECARRALALQPRDPAVVLQLGQCLIAAGRRREALHVAEQVAACPLDRADWNDALGTLLTWCGEPARARPFFERAVDLMPQEGSFLYNLATAQRMTGDLEDAERSVNRAIALRPEDVQACYMRTDLRTQTAESNHIEALEGLLRPGTRSPPEEILLCFAIAKELEDLRQYEDSFAYLRRGCDLQRRQFRYDVGADVAVMEGLIQQYDHKVTSHSNGFHTDECIFVVGLPRSGTTLVERIIASHSDVQAPGELQAFPLETLAAVKRLVGGSPGVASVLQHALEIDAEALGRAYIAATRPQTGRTARFVDKLPTNYLYAGLIRRALPRAKIIAVAREPMDSGYAMYKTPFVSAYPFSYDLSDLGRYYAAWHRLMRHWQAVLGDSLLIVQYEALVAHQEAVTRRMLAHCGLEWQDRCLTFHADRSAVTTASAVQVRQPVYSSSVGKWRYFERELRPLMDELSRHEPPSGWGFDVS